MKYRLSIEVIVILILTFFWGCNRYQFKPDYAKNSNVFQKDFQYVVAAIESLHPGILEEPLPFASNFDWNSTVDAFLPQFAEVNNDIEFALKTSAFLSKLNDSHISLAFDMRNTRFLPIEFGLFGGHLHVVAVYDSTFASLLFAEVSKINDLSAGKLVDLAQGYESGDNEYWKQRIGSRSFSFLRWEPFYAANNLLAKGQKDVRIETKGIDTVISIPFSLKSPMTNVLQIENMGRNEISKIQSIENRMVEISDHSALYVQLNNIRGRVDEEFINRIFEEATSKNMHNLILDLRVNSGGNSNWCNAFYSHIAKESDTVKIYKSWRRIGNENVLHKGSKIGHYIPQRAPLFEGHVYILTSVRTLSSATFFVVAAQQNNLGTVIGMPCGNNSFRYGYISPRIDLPETGFNLYTSTRIWERNVEPTQTALMPDIYVEMTIDDLKEGTDTILERALELCSGK